MVDSALFVCKKVHTIHDLKHLSRVNHRHLGWELCVHLVVEGVLLLMPQPIFSLFFDCNLRLLLLSVLDYLREQIVLVALILAHFLLIRVLWQKSCPDARAINDLDFWVRGFIDLTLLPDLGLLGQLLVQGVFLW